MVEQIVNMKKRYQALVERFTKGNFESYFAEFFALHTCVRGVRWIQEKDSGDTLFSDPDVNLTPRYLLQHQEFKSQLDGVWLNTDLIEQEDKQTSRELYEAVIDLRSLFEAKDVFEHVFGDDVDITATKAGITVSPWGTGESI